MLKFLINTKEDLREAAKIETRRQFEEERKKRIFNGKKRLYGLDYETLEKQIAEKTARKKIEAERERQYNEEIIRQAKLLKAKEVEQQNIAKLRNMDLNHFRSRFQRKDLSRELDITQPDGDQSVRLAEGDPRMGLSSAMTFTGEDPYHADRKRAQKEQQRAWLDQQMRERQQAVNDRRRSEAMLEDCMKSIDQRLMDMSIAERENHSKLKESIRRYNEELASRKRENMRVQQQQNQEDNLAEIYNMLGSDMLNANSNAGGSKTSLDKNTPNQHRGLSLEEMRKLHQEQNQQIEEKKKRKNEEKIKEILWEQHALNMDRELTLKNMELEKIKKAQLEDQFRTNRALAEEQKARRDYMNKVVYRNETNDEYWGQFNRTSR